MKLHKIISFFKLAVLNTNSTQETGKSEKSNLFLNIFVSITIMIAVWLIKIFIELMHRWFINAKCLFSNCITKIWGGWLHWRFNNYERINNFPKNVSTQEALNLSNKQNEEVLEDKNILSISPIKSNGEKIPIHEDTKDNCDTFYLNNNNNASSLNTGNSTRNFYKNLIKDNISMRYELLMSKKELCTTIKRWKELQKVLHDLKKNNNQNETRRNSQTHSRRISFFGKTFNSWVSETDSSVCYIEKNKNESMYKRQCISVLDHTTDKIKQLVGEIMKLKKEIVELCNEVEQDGQRLIQEETERSKKLQKLDLMEKNHKQASKDIKSLGNGLSKELEKIQNLKQLFEEFSSSTEIINEESNDF